MFFTIPNFHQRMIEHPISVLTVLSLVAIITTICLFFCGIPICLEIRRRKNTKEISGFPFLMGFLGGTFWLRYGLLKTDYTMIVVNIVGVTLMFFYLLFYFYYTKSKRLIILELLVIILVISTMLILVGIYDKHITNQLGFVCMTFNIINFGAPLAGLAVVFKKKSCDTLPLPLCLANLLVSCQWCFYGVLVRDKFIIIPNGAGVILALLQISLFLIFPRKPGTRALLSYCFKCFKVYEQNKKSESFSNVRSLTTGNLSDWKFQRLVDRNGMQPSRSSCIAFLKSKTFNAGGYYIYDKHGSTRSRCTVESIDTQISNLCGLGRVLSISQPELYNVNQIILNNPMYGANSFIQNEDFNASCSSNNYFNSSRFSNGKINPLFLNSSASSQYFANLMTNGFNSGQQSLQQSQKLQAQLQAHPQKLKKFQPDSEKNKIDKIEFQLNEQDLKRTISAADLTS